MDRVWMGARFKVRQSNPHRCAESEKHMMIVYSEIGFLVVITSLHNPAFPHSLFQISIYVSLYPCFNHCVFLRNEKFNGSRGADAFMSVTQRHYRHSSPNTKSQHKVGLKMRSMPSFSNTTPPLLKATMPIYKYPAFFNTQLHLPF